MDWLSLKIFYPAKVISKKVKGQAIDWEKIFVKKITSDKGLLYKIYKVLLKLNNKQKSQCKMGQEILNKEDI